MRNIYSLILFFVAVLFNSCVSVETSSEIDPDFRNSRFASVCVKAEIQDLNTKHGIEENVVAELKELGVRAFSSSYLFPSTREWSEDQIRDILMKENIEALILISIVDNYEVRRKLPTRVTTETTTEEKETDDGDKVMETKTEHTVEDNRERVTRHLSIMAELFEADTQRKAWIATTNSTMDLFWGHDNKDVYQSYAREIVDKLIEDELLKRWKK